MKTLSRLVAVVAAVVVQSWSLSAKDAPIKNIGGITNIHVEAFVPYTESFAGTSVGNVTRWLEMSEDGLAKKLYLEHRHRGDFAASNSVPDILFPSNTVAARVWRGHGEALTNAYELFKEKSEIANTIIDSEVVGVLTNFGPLVKSVTRGVGSATIPYVDADGNQRFGKAVILGCDQDDWTAYKILTNELSRVGDGWEDTHEDSCRRYIVTNSTVKILGSRTPSVAFGSLGYVIISTSEEVWSAISQAAWDFGLYDKKPFYDARHAAVVGSDAELLKRDPDYPRNFKTDGFTFFGYAYLSAKYQLTAAKMLEDYGFNPELAGTNTTFHYLATLCSEKCEDTNSRMRIDLQGSEAALRAIGFSLRFSNLLLVNAGILDKEFMTFDRDWQYDPETLAKISVWTASVREKLGLSDVTYSFAELEDRVSANASIGYTEGRGFQQLFCAGTTGGLEENPCEACLPTNTVAAFCFQPNAAAWTELNERLFSLFGQKSELLDNFFAVFKSHSKSFGKSAAIGVVLGSDVKTDAKRGLSSALDLVSAVKIEDENLWISIRILLEQFGCKTHDSTTWPGEITVCEFPDSTLRVSYDRTYKIIKLATSKTSSGAVARALRYREARLISSANKVFADRMGVKEGESLPDHNTLFYFAPECDTVLHETLKEYLDAVGLGALSVLINHDDVAGTWACGTGKADAEKGIFESQNFLSTNIWTKYHGLFEATAKTVGQIAADAYPYDASKAHVFTSGGITLHVSRADNWDDVNHCLYPYDGDNIRVRAQLVAPNGKIVDYTASGKLSDDGSFVLEAGKVSFCGYFSSEGVFCEFKNGLITCYLVGRLAPEIEPELSVLPSAEEIAEEVKKVVDAIGIERIDVSAANSDGRTGPFGEETVVRTTTVTPVPGGGLSKLLAKKGTDTRDPMAYYMPSNTAFGATFTVSDGALSNALAAVKFAQPELYAALTNLFLAGGLTEEQLLATVNDGLALGISKDEDGREPYLAVRLRRGQEQNWAALTNRLYNTAGVTVVDFRHSTESGIWEAIAFTRTDPDTGRTTSRSYSRVFEDTGREPVFIITQGTNLYSGVMAEVRRAGLGMGDRLVDDATFQKCYTEDSSLRGFIYLAPAAANIWFYDRISVSEDGELVLTRRTSAAQAPLEMSAARFLVNYLEALTGEESVVEFEKDPAVDEVLDKATSNVVAIIHRMRTALGVTGLNFYDCGFDADGRYGNSEIAIGTKGDGCQFLRRYAASEPASEVTVEQYIPDTACALATMDSEAGLVAQDLSTAASAVGELIGEKYPEFKAKIDKFLASDDWKIVTNTLRSTGSHKAFAVLQDFEHPFVSTKDVPEGMFASLSAGYSAVCVMGPMKDALPFLLLKEALETKGGNWRYSETNAINCLVYHGKIAGKDLSAYLRPTIMLDTRNNVMVFATTVKAAIAAINAGHQGTNRLIETEKFFDVTGFKKGESLPKHNTLYYLAPQNDEILGCTLRRLLKPYLPEGYAMLLDAPSLKGYWGAAYGVRVNDAFRLYVHAGAKGHTAFLAAGQALLKTVVESICVRRPYVETTPKVLRSADQIRLIEPTGNRGYYATSVYTGAGDYLRTEFLKSGSDNAYSFYEMSAASILGRNCLFLSVKNGTAVYNAGRNAFHLMIVDDEADPAAYTAGVAMAFSGAREQTLPAGEKVEQKLWLYPTDAKITKVTGLPKGLSLKKTKDGYFLTGTPTKVGEDCRVALTATCAGRETYSREYHFIISNYASDYVELDASIEMTAGVAATTNLTSLIGWAASGVPAGMKFDKNTGALYGTPAKPGTYVVVFAKKINGKTEKVSTVITVGGEDSISIDVAFNDKTCRLSEEDGTTCKIYVGVKIDWPIAVTGLEDVETKLTAKGLPSGLKLVKTVDKLTKEVSYAIKGIATKASVVDKKSGEVKPSMVTIKGTNKYKWTGSQTFDLFVKALPEWAIGTYNGYHGSTVGDLSASMKVTVSKVGKISVSINGVAPSMGKMAVDTFTLNGFNSYDPANKCFAFSLENVKMKSGNVYRFAGAIDLDPNLEAFTYDSGRLSAYIENETRLRVSWGENFDWTGYVFPTGKSQLMLDLTDEVNPGLEGLTLKFAKGGKVTVAGTVVDPETGKNVRVLASSALVYESNEDIPRDGFFPGSVGFVVKAKTPFYAYVPVWLKRANETMVEVYETDPTKAE